MYCMCSFVLHLRISGHESLLLHNSVNAPFFHLSIAILHDIPWNFPNDYKLIKWTFQNIHHPLGQGGRLSFLWGEVKVSVHVAGIHWSSEPWVVIAGDGDWAWTNLHSIRKRVNQTCIDAKHLNHLHCQACDAIGGSRLVCPNRIAGSLDLQDVCVDGVSWLRRREFSLELNAWNARIFFIIDIVTFCWFRNFVAGSVVAVFVVMADEEPTEDTDDLALPAFPSGRFFFHSDHELFPEDGTSPPASPPGQKQCGRLRIQHIGGSLAFILQVRPPRLLTTSGSNWAFIIYF